MQLLVGLTLIGLLLLCVTALFQLKQTMLDDRMQKTKNLVEVSVGVLTHHQKLATAGTLSQDDAQKAAKEALRNLRYGDKDYFFILDTSHTYVLLPPKPENEGKNVSDLKDAKGKLLVREIVATGVAGGGFVDYWFPRAGQTEASPKLSYIAPFPAWNWVIGTVIYIDDVNTEFQRSAILLGGISLVLLIGLSLIGYLIGRSVIQHLGGDPKMVAEIMQRVAAGDLTTRTDSAPQDSLLHSLDTMIASLRVMVSEINGDANSLVVNAERIATASDEVASAAEQQSDATSAMAAAIEQLTVSSNHISDSARVGEATHAIQQLSGTVTDVSTRIRTLEGRANQISSIANVIKDIAGQTNLLALNAAIEAARAGEQGRGFAVVADEVRKLAERTSLATTEIEQMIVAIQSDTTGAVQAMNAALPEVEQGVSLAHSASESLRAIEAGARRTLERVGDVANATHEQSAASTSIAQRVEQIANMVEDTTTTIRGTTATAHQLEDIANNLKVMIGRFRV